GQLAKKYKPTNSYGKIFQFSKLTSSITKRKPKPKQDFNLKIKVTRKKKIEILPNKSIRTRTTKFTQARFVANHKPKVSLLQLLLLFKITSFFVQFLISHTRIHHKILKNSRANRENKQTNLMGTKREKRYKSQKMFAIIFVMQNLLTHKRMNLLEYRIVGNEVEPIETAKI
ncbi:LOW QUALITY PROTEIN: hypothetical protein TorRG33x02_342400, partial [Trema orientale]